MKGFTLVEVLVATVLLSLVMVMSYSALYTGTRSWSAGETRMARNDDFRTGLRFIKKYISQLSPMLQIEEDEVLTMFKGDEETLHFITALPAHTGGSGLNLVTLFIDDPEEQPNLYMAYQTALPGVGPEANFDDPENVATVELMSSIDSVSFEYFGTKEDADEPEWHSTWDEDNLFPTSIRVVLSPLDSTQYIPDLTIPVRITDVDGMNQFVMNTMPIEEPEQNRNNTRATSARAGLIPGGAGGGMGFGGMGREFTLEDLERFLQGGMGGGMTGGMTGGMGGRGMGGFTQ